MIYQHPLAYLLGIEGLALLRAWAGDFDAAFVDRRLAEVRRLLATEALAGHDGVLVGRGDTRTGYRQWAATYDEPRNSLFDAEEPVMHQIIDAFPPGDGSSVSEFPVADGVVPFPGWGFFDEPDAVAGHATFLGVPRESRMAKTLYAVDELSGFISACALVRPTGIEGMTPKSVKKKLKQPSFAAAVDRDDVRGGADLLGVDFDEHVAFVIAALEARAGELGLEGQAPASA